MAENRLVATLLGLLGRARTHERALVAGLSEAERAARGTLEHWSAKDLVAHITSWHGLAAGLLIGAVRGETPAWPGSGFNEANARFYAENEPKSWQQVLAEADQAVGRLSGLLPQLADEDLTDPARYPWRRGQPLAPGVTRPIYWHPMSHLTEHYLLRHDLPAAETVRADVLTAAGELAAWPDLRGNTLYVAAASYALAGASAEALASLREALALAPFLVDWSKRDPSLASLRGEPGYQALYQG